MADQPNTPSAIQTYFDKLPEEARNSGQPKVVENAMVASTKMNALLSDGFNQEEPIDHTLFLQRMYLCFDSAGIGRLPSFKDLFGSQVETGIDKDIDDDDMEKDNEQVLEHQGVEDDNAHARADGNGDS